MQQGRDERERERETQEQGQEKREAHDVCHASGVKQWRRKNFKNSKKHGWGQMTRMNVKLSFKANKQITGGEQPELEAGMLGGLDFKGAQTAGNGSVITGEQWARVASGELKDTKNAVMDA